MARQCRENYFEFWATISIMESRVFFELLLECCSLCEALSLELRDARGSDEWSAQRKPILSFWQVAQSRLLRADSSKANTEHE